ncbi:hypothetical protein ACJMK2_020252 [Sinanodonta woodiana]|uniref:Target of Nesh-SH3/FNDC1 C-terminal domain-containing protein n=1 Tax=Sinanodonta woodiana TaxID=1069815 RepID=A0ABD3U0P4_SINWO
MKLEKMHVFYCSLLLSISLFSTSSGAESGNSDETCVLNIVVPKTAITASCGTSATFERKFSVMENQISQLERDLRNTQMRSLYAFSRDNLKDRINAIEQRLQHTDVLKGDLSQVKHGQLPSRNADNGQSTAGDQPNEFEDILKDRFHHYLHPLIRKELETLKEEIKKEIWDNMLQAIRNNKIPVKSRQDKLLEDNKEPPFNDSSKINHFPNDIDKHGQNHHNQNHSYHWHHRHHRQDSIQSETADVQNHKKDDVDNTFPLGNDFPDTDQNQQYNLQKDWDSGHPRSAIYHPRAHQTPERNQAQDQSKQETPKDNQILETLKSDMINLIDSRIQQLKESVKVYREEIDKKVDELSKASENRTSLLENRMQQFEGLFQNAHTSLLKRMNTNTQQLQDFRASVQTMQNNSEFQRTMRETIDLWESSLMTKFTSVTSSVKSDIQDLTKKYERVQHYQVDLEHTMQFNQNQTMAYMNTIKNNLTKLLEFVHEVRNNLNDLKNETSFNLTKLASTSNIGKGHSEIIGEGINLRYTMDRVKNLENSIASTQENVDGLEVKHSIDISKLVATMLVLQTNVSEIQISQMTQNEKMDVIRNAVENVTKSVHYIQLDLLELQISDQKWTEFNFEYDYQHSDCYGNKYVKKTNYELGKIVGVVLCSPEKYKILLGESLREPFRDIGDTRRMGEDHCEFVGARNEARAKVGRIAQQKRILGYKRSDWGEVPRLGIVSFINPIPAWYECGLTIP